MKYRKFGKTDLSVSILGYGAFALGGSGWPETNEKEALLTLETAFENGINFFDTAPAYGKGRSEEILGNVLKDVRKDIIIATKCGVFWDNDGKTYKNLSPDQILFDIEGSLKRLKTDYIDLYQIHWPDHKTPLQDTFRVLKKLKKEKVIKYIGVSNFHLPLLGKACRICSIDSVQNQYNLLNREAEKDIIPFCRKNHIAFIPYSPLAQGLLTGKFTEEFNVPHGHVREHNPLFKNSVRYSDAVKKIRQFQQPVVKTSIHFLLSCDIIPTVIISCTDRTHLKENIQFVEEFV